MARSGCLSYRSFACCTHIVYCTIVLIAKVKWLQMILFLPQTRSYWVIAFKFIHLPCCTLYFNQTSFCPQSIHSSFVDKYVSILTFKHLTTVCWQCWYGNKRSTCKHTRLLSQNSWHNQLHPPLDFASEKILSVKSDGGVWPFLSLCSNSHIYCTIWTAFEFGCLKNMCNCLDLYRPREFTLCFTTYQISPDQAYA